MPRRVQRTGDRKAAYPAVQVGANSAELHKDDVGQWGDDGVEAEVINKGCRTMARCANVDEDVLLVWPHRIQCVHEPPRIPAYLALSTQKPRPWIWRPADIDTLWSDPHPSMHLVNQHTG